MVNIVIPMAGRGRRFSEEETDIPKPYADMNGKPMFVRVIENFILPDARFLLIAKSEHFHSEYELIKSVQNKYNAKIITVENVTEGTACTALFAREEINNDTPLLIVMADQIIDIDIKKFIDDCSEKKLDGHLVCFHTYGKEKRYSYAKLNESGKVELIKEKEVISDIATAGIYYFSKGKYFVDAAIDMIINNDRVNNEFYVAPVYNYLISRGKQIGVYMIEKKGAHDLGTKDKLENYLKLLQKNQ